MERIRHRADFLAAAGAARVHMPAFTLQSRQRDDAGPARIGFTVTRKVGTAVERNRVRRRLRAVVALAGPTVLRSSRDYVLIGRRVTLERDFTALCGDLRHAITKLERLPSQPSRAASPSSSDAPSGDVS